MSSIFEVGSFHNQKYLSSILQTAIQRLSEVFVDGGVRRGKDVFRALALGARAVFVGRPFLFGLAVGGEDGPRRVLDCLREELLSTMQLAGVQNCGEITPAHVRKKSTIAGSEREAQRGRL